MKNYCLILFLLLMISAQARAPRSFSDNGIYPKLCHTLATDEERFAHFKRDPLFALFAENVSEEEGAQELKALLRYAPEFLEEMQRIKVNDQIGDPHTFTYGKHGAFSPTSLRYARIAAQLKRGFGSLEKLRVLEIGAGYGGLSTIIHTLLSPQSYTLVDLPEPLELSSTYLKKQKIENVHFLDLEKPPKEADLVISYLFFSECDRSIQKIYIDKVLARAKAGFLICAPGHWKEIPYTEKEHRRVKPLSKDELIKRLASCGIEVKCVKEEPASGKDHFILYWSNNDFLRN